MLGEVVLAAAVTGLFGVIIEVLRRLWRDNKKDHAIVVDRLDHLANKHDDVSERVYDIAADVRDIKGDVRTLKSDHVKLREDHTQLSKQVNS